MRFSVTSEGQEVEIINLFKATFTASEGADEGVLISELVQKQLATTPSDDIHVITAEENGTLLGACVFTRMTFDQDNRTVFLLAPLAVMTARHGQGIGQKLLNNALKFLREANVDVVMTYGDPNYYNKVSFQSVSENQAAAPFKLQYPHGWLGLSLTEQTLLPLKGRSHCVSALNDPVFW